MNVYNKIRRFGTCLIACAAIFFSTVKSYGMSVTPLAVELSTSGPNNKTTLRVHNDSVAPIPVEVLTSKLTVEEDGKVTNVPIKGKFLIFPPQATIAPGTSQSFRVQWMGDANLKSSESYSLSVNQLPVDLGKKTNGVQVVFNFSVIVNVSPAGAKPAVSVAKTELSKGSSEGAHPIITFENTGNSYALIGEGSVVLTSGSWTKALAPDEMLKLFGMGLIEPGKRRRFTLAVPVPAGISRYDVKLDLKRPRP